MIAAHRSVHPATERHHANSGLRSRHKQHVLHNEYEEAPSESYADISTLLDRHRPYRPQGFSKNSHNGIALDCDDLKYDASNDGKDRFLELAQAALEEATKEDERKGVIQEVVEVLIAKTGAPRVAEVISEQLRSQELIERLAESHEDDRRRRSSSKLSVCHPNILKEPSESVQQNESDAENTQAILLAQRRQMISEFMLRLFRVLLLASIVGLVYHFVLAFYPSLFMY